VGVGDWCVLCRGGGESDCHRPVLARIGRHRTRSSPAVVTRTAVWPMTPDSTRRQRRTVGCDLREFAIDRSRTESERYQYVDVCHSKHRVGVRAVAVIAVLVCTRFVAFVKTVPASAFGQLDQSDEWRNPVDVVGHTSDCSVLSVATSTSAFSIRND